MAETPDAYGRLAYPGLIAWPQRLQREAPLFQRVLGGAPAPRILDLGSGSGEHCRFLKALGHDLTGVDASPSQVAAARSADPNGTYLQASLTELTQALTPGYGGAYCVGNTLPHLTEAREVQTFLAGLAALLLPGAPFLLQVLNYDRILDRGERTFPIVLRPEGDEADDATVFLRLMTHHGGGRLTFTPAHLRYRPGTATPLELVAAQEVALRGWRRSEVEAHLASAGFQVTEVLGSMTGAPWGPEASDLVVVAERKAPHC